MNSGRPFSRRAAVAGPLLCILGCLFLSGCSGSPPRPVPPARESARGWNQRGLASEARGDHDAALSAFRESLRINRSVEDFDGIKVALVNLARVHRLKGEPAPAKERIDEALLLVLPADPLFPEAAFEKAKVHLAMGDLAGAGEWAEKAVPAQKEASAGRMLNLLARVRFLEGRTAEARARAQAALEANRASGGRAEEANSLRLLGDIAQAGGDRKGAEARYFEALAIDKEMAESRKIAADLRALGAAAAARGNTEQAIDFYGRAAAVSRNGGDPRGAEAALSEISRLRGEGAPRDGTKPSL